MYFRTASRAMRGASRVVLVAVFGGLLVSAVDVHSASASTSAVPSRYVAVGPSRLADTRGAGAFGFTRLDASTIRVKVAGVGGVPADASAAALTVTATDARSAGFVTVFPTGTQRELTANVNFNGPGEIVANGAIVALGDRRRSRHLRRRRRRHRRRRLGRVRPHPGQHVVRPLRA